MEDYWINNRTMLVYEQKFSIHGRVLESRAFTFGWVRTMMPSPFSLPPIPSHSNSLGCEMETSLHSL